MSACRHCRPPPCPLADPTHAGRISPTVPSLRPRARPAQLAGCPQPAAMCTPDAARRPSLDRSHVPAGRLRSPTLPCMRAGRHHSLEREREWRLGGGSEGETGISDLGLDWDIWDYGPLTSQIAPDIKLVVSDRVRLVSRVVSGPALWVEILAQALPYPSDRVGTDLIIHGLGWVRVGFFRVVPRAAHRTQPIWPSILGDERKQRVTAHLGRRRRGHMPAPSSPSWSADTGEAAAELP